MPHPAIVNAAVVPNTAIIIISPVCMRMFLRIYIQFHMLSFILPLYCLKQKQYI